jgi:hypothetical protein
MAPRRAPLAEQIERRISDPLCGAGGGFPLRQREYTFGRRLPSGQVTLLCSPHRLGAAPFREHNAVLFVPPRAATWRGRLEIAEGFQLLPRQGQGPANIGPGRSLLRERRTEAVHQLPKLRTRVRFPSLAPRLAGAWPYPYLVKGETGKRGIEGSPGKALSHWACCRFGARSAAMRPALVLVSSRA